MPGDREHHIDRRSADKSAVPRRELSLFDSVSIIIGVVIGAGIYETSPVVAANVSGQWGLIGVWILGGLLSLAGALCYAELATAYPKEGGDYVYLNEAFGPRCGFLFAWAQLWVVRPGSIGAMAFVFARYANQLRPIGDGPHALAIYAAAAVIALTALNLLGVRTGKWAQNSLSAAKYLGLALVCAAGLFFVGRPAAEVSSLEPDHATSFGQAMIFVLFAYGGWNEMAFVGAEVRDPRKNIFRALWTGTLAVMLVYVLANVAFVHALGLTGVRAASEVAGDTLQQAFGPWGRRAIQWLIIVTALGAIQGMIFTGSRIYYAMGNDYRIYAWLGRWSGRQGTPLNAILLQGAITIALVVGFGWTQNGFQAIVNFETPIFWIFLFLVAVGVIVLRFRHRELERPYRVPLYPLLPIVFGLACLFMVQSSLSWAYEHKSREAFYAIALMVLGVVASLLGRPSNSGPPTPRRIA
jgi:basic amino acid/polyamine antiporter, APA family